MTAAPKNQGDVASLSQSPADLARLEVNLEAISALREKLEELCPATDHQHMWERKHFVDTLNAITNFVGNIMDTALPSSDDGLDIIQQHPATELLSKLSAALKRLDEGYVVEILQPTDPKGGSTYNASDRLVIHTCLMSVNILANVKDITIKDAQQRVGKALNELGIKVRGKHVTKKNLDSWRRAPPGSRSPSHLVRGV
jgi:hypothetical protein